MNKKILFKSIKFFDFEFKYIINRFTNSGGYLVAPAASALAEINKNKLYYNSLRYADVAILDSGFLYIIKNLSKKMLQNWIFVFKKI